MNKRLSSIPCVLLGLGRVGFLVELNSVQNNFRSVYEGLARTISRNYGLSQQ